MNETYKNTQRLNAEGQLEKRGMRRVPDILSVSLQNFLYGCQPELPEKLGLQHNSNCRSAYWYVTYLKWKVKGWYSLFTF